jgi:hypothetical protein
MVFNQIIQKKSGNQIKLKRNNNKKKAMISPKKIAISMISNKKNSINGSKCKIWGNKEKKKNKPCNHVSLTRVSPQFFYILKSE